MSSDTGDRRGGIGILGVLFVGLFFAKIFAIDPVATWSWWWVTLPLWVMPAIVLAGGVFAMIALFFKDLNDRKKDEE